MLGGGYGERKTPSALFTQRELLVGNLEDLRAKV